MKKNDLHIYLKHHGRVKVLDQVCFQTDLGTATSPIKPTKWFTAQNIWNQTWTIWVVKWGSGEWKDLFYKMVGQIKELDNQFSVQGQGH